MQKHFSLYKLTHSQGGLGHRHLWGATILSVKVKVKSLSRVWLFVTPMDCSLPGSTFHGILQARVLEWVAISFSRGSSRPRDRTLISCIPGRRFNLWATREAHVIKLCSFYRQSISKSGNWITCPQFVNPIICILSISGLKLCPETSTPTPKLHSLPCAHLPLHSEKW